MNHKNAFTLIELLIVIAIIVLQLAIIMPLLGASREQALEAVCLSNQKQLCLAWSSYYNDYNGLLVGGSTYRTGEHQRPTPWRWVEPPMMEPIYGSTRAPLPYTKEQRLNGIRAGKLFAYTESEKVYHCPGDKTFTNPEPYAEYRSYTIAGLMNGEHFVTRVDGNEFKPINQYSTYLGKELKVAIKTSDIDSPSSKYVFVEEDVVKGKPVPQEYNRGSFVLLGGGGMNWWDVPAGYHNGSSTLGFADGHAERHKWRDKDTINLIENATPDPDPSNNEDLKWLVNGYIPVTP